MNKALSIQKQQIVGVKALQGPPQGACNVGMPSREAKTRQRGDANGRIKRQSTLALFSVRKKPHLVAFA
jgi:hypothetical protein